MADSLTRLKRLPDDTEPGWHPDPASLLRDRYWNGHGWTHQTRSGMPVGPASTEAVAEDTRWRLVSVTTSHQLPGMTLTAHLGEVFGATVRSRNLFSDLGSGLRNAVGGEVRGYTDMLAVARHEALDRLRQEAHALGGNAVVSMRLATNSVVDGVVEIIAYGGAVRVVDDGEDRASDGAAAG
ncbi:MAG TPA: heavy metal-binding domain-containing protein [Baekduia sp.]